MKKTSAILLVLSLLLTLCAGARAADEPENLLDTLCAPSCAVETDTGALLVTDVYNKCVWLIEEGHATRYAGRESVTDRYGQAVGGYDDGEAAESLFREPWAIAPFLGGWAVSDTQNNALRLITADGVQTINGRASDPLIESAEMGVVYDRPTGLTADEAGNLYVSNTDGGTIYRIDPEGEVDVVAGDLNEPMGLFWHEGELYVAEAGAHRIVKLSQGTLRLVAGSGEEGFVDGPAGEARFSWPSAVAVDDQGCVYVADTANGAVRRIQNAEVDTLLSPAEGELEAFPVSPRALLLYGEALLVCDPYARMLVPVKID